MDQLTSEERKRADLVQVLSLVWKEQPTIA